MMHVHMRAAPAVLALALAAVCGLGTAAARPLGAQQPAPGSRVSVEFEGRSRIDGMDAAAVREWNATARRIAAVLESHPAIQAPPESLCTRVSTRVADILSDGRPTAHVHFHQPIPDARGACSGRTGGGVEIRINDPDALRDLAVLQNPDDDPREHFYALAAQVDAAGPGTRFRDTYNRWVVLTRDARPLMLALTREEFLGHHIRALERAGAQLAGTPDASPAPTAVDLDHWLRVEKPRIAAELRQAIRAAEPHLTAGQIREMREQNERNLVAMEAAMREAAGRTTDTRSAVSEVISDALDRTRADLVRLRAMLHAMTPEQRRRPTCLDPRLPGLVNFTACTAGDQRLVRLDPRGFDPSLPRSAVQLIVVRTDNERHAMEDPRRAALRWHVFDTLDYPRLAAELHRPPSR
jgi:hypothetical protein